MLLSALLSGTRDTVALSLSALLKMVSFAGGTFEHWHRSANSTWATPFHLWSLLTVAARSV